VRFFKRIRSASVSRLTGVVGRKSDTAMSVRATARSISSAAVGRSRWSIDGFSSGVMVA
jgi:hypothetical protein